MSACSLYDRKHEESQIILHSHSNSLRQSTLLTSPSLVTDQELFAQKSDLRKRKFVYCSWLVGVSAAGIIVFKSKGLFAVLSIYAGHKIGSIFSNSCDLSSKTNIFAKDAFDSLSKHHDEIAHFNYMPLVPIGKTVDYCTVADNYHRVQRSRYI